MDSDNQSTEGEELGISIKRMTIGGRIVGRQTKPVDQADSKGNRWQYPPIESGAGAGQDHGETGIEAMNMTNKTSPRHIIRQILRIEKDFIKVERFSEFLGTI